MKIIVKDYTNACGSYVLINMEGEKRPFRSINKKYLNNGVLTKTLNGIEMNASETFNDLMTQLQSEHELYTLINSGMAFDEAMKQFALKYLSVK